MFEQLTTRFNDLFSKFGRKGKITESNIQDAIREVKLALLEADVNYKVVKEFVENVGKQAVGERVLRSVSAGQMFIKIVYDELVRVMGGEGSTVSLRKGRLALLLCGLQGSGKTTTAAKIALRYKKDYRFLLVSTDLYRPAAMEQLKVLCDQVGVAFFDEALKIKKPVNIVRKAKRYADRNGYNGIIVDTAGRMHLDDELMEELVRISRVIKFDETYFVADATVGQVIAETVSAFHEKLLLTGLVLTKFDSDTRGGAALSMKAVTGKPISFAGTGEKLEEMELFYPERVASRILGKGDILTLIENTRQVVDEEEARRLEKKLKKNSFNLEDFRDQLRKIRQMGSLSRIMQLMPGMGAMKKANVNDKELVKIEAIINSMTAFERKNTSILSGSRKQRIARGSGTTILDVSRLLTKFQNMKKMMKKMSKNPQIFDKFSGNDIVSGGMPEIPGGLPGDGFPGMKPPF